MSSQQAERIRELELTGLFKRLPPETVGSIVTRECNRITARLYGFGSVSTDNGRRMAAGD